MSQSTLRSRWIAARGGRPLPPTPAASQLAGSTNRRYYTMRARSYARSAKRSAMKRMLKTYGPGPRYDYTLNPKNKSTDTYRRVITIKNANQIGGSGTTYGFTTVYSLTGALPNASVFSNCNNSGTAGISELVALQQLFTYYKIEKAVVTLTMKLTEFSDAVEPPNVLVRYNYDPNRYITVGGGTSQLDSSTDVKVHRFTNESMVFQYTTYPKVLTPQYLYSGVTADGYAYGVKEGTQPWVDLSSTGSGAGAAVPYWGTDFVFGNIPSGQTIQCDIELHCAFKWQI